MFPSFLLIKSVDNLFFYGIEFFYLTTLLLFFFIILIDRIIRLFKTEIR